MADKFEHNCKKGETNYGFEDGGKDGFHIDSCCGGCYAVVNVRFCPFCGKKLKMEDMIKIGC